MSNKNFLQKLNKGIDWRVTKMFLLICFAKYLQDLVQQLFISNKKRIFETKTENIFWRKTKLFGKTQENGKEGLLITR